MMESIPWTTYIAHNNPNGVNRVLSDYGYPQADFEEEIPEAIQVLLTEKGESATVDLLRQHPDFDIIVDTYKRSQAKYKKATGEENLPHQVIVNPPQQTMPQQNTGNFSSTLQNVVLVVMAFWLINKIISK
jgi:hypothetical protein